MRTVAKEERGTTVENGEAQVKDGKGSVGQKEGLYRK